MGPRPALGTHRAMVLINPRSGFLQGAEPTSETCLPEGNGWPAMPGSGRCHEWLSEPGDGEDRQTAQGLFAR